MLAGGLNSEFSWLSGTALKIAPLGIFFKKVPETTVRGTTNQFPFIKNGVGRATQQQLFSLDFVYCID